MRRVRYQFGSLELLKGAKRDVWTFRFYQLGADGKRQYRRIRVGTTDQYPTETGALRALEGLRLSVNSGKIQTANPTFGAVNLANYWVPPCCTQSVCSNLALQLAPKSYI